MVLIAERSMHVHEIQRVIEQRCLVTVKLDVKGQTSRMTFRVTDDGRWVATDAVKAVIGEVTSTPSPLLIGVANLDLLAPQEYLSALDRRLAQTSDRLRGIEAAARAQGVLPPTASEEFSPSLRQLRADRAWVSERVGETS